MRFLMCFVIFAMLSCGASISQTRERYLDRKNVELFFDNSTIVGYWPRDNSKTFAYFAPDGKLYAEGLSYPSQIGHWYINDDNAVCTEIENTTCMYVGSDGRNIRGWLKTPEGYAPLVVMTSSQGDTRNLIPRSKSAQDEQRNFAARKQEALKYMLEGMRMGLEDYRGSSSGSSGFDPDRFNGRSSGGSGFSGNGNIGGLSTPSGSGVHGSCGGGGC